MIIASAGDAQQAGCAKASTLWIKSRKRAGFTKRTPPSILPHEPGGLLTRKKNLWPTPKHLVTGVTSTHFSVVLVSDDVGWHSQFEAVQVFDKDALGYQKWAKPIHGLVGISVSKGQDMVCSYSPAIGSREVASGSSHKGHFCACTPTHQQSQPTQRAQQSQGGRINIRELRCAALVLSLGYGGAEGNRLRLPAALSLMLRVADSDPSSSANSTTMISQLFPTASEGGHNLIGTNS
jgi:hypothetical protein